MTTRDELVSKLESAGVLGGVRWAYRLAAERTLDLFREADGHDEAWLGTTRFVYFRDRLDRVFGCGRYLLPKDGDPALGADLLHAELSDQDIATMPQLPASLVRRSNLNGSPGWAWEDGRFLIAACPVGQIKVLPWPQRSPTKQMVARQPAIDPAQGSLFDDDEQFAGLVALLTRSVDLDLPTYVVAHTLDSVSHRGELVFGSPRLNTGGGDAWNWYADLLEAPPTNGGRESDLPLAPLQPDDEPPAPVRLRRPDVKRQTGQTDSGS